jgi:hypothetical protein
VSADALVQDVAIVWPDAAKAGAPPAATPADESKGLGGEEIRDKMIRGGRAPAVSGRVQ